MQERLVIKGAWILPALLALVLALVVVPTVLMAAGPDRAGRQKSVQKPPARSATVPAPHFSNLPGVVPSESLVERSAYECETDIAEIRRPRRGYRMLYGDSAPTRVYRCKAGDGTVYTGTSLPNTNWVPGINPHHLPESR